MNYDQLQVASDGPSNHLEEDVFDPVFNLDGEVNLNHNNLKHIPIAKSQ
jgi:hypothetical protein